MLYAIPYHLQLGIYKIEASDKVGNINLIIENIASFKIINF